jgi:acetyl-CoA carboxylase carboxyl transferase subunit beta
MRFFSRDKPKIKIQNKKQDGYSGWLKCTDCQELIHCDELAKNLNCCPKCNFHYRLSQDERIALLADKGSFFPLFTEISSADPLNFVDSMPYKERLKLAEEQSGSDDALIVGEAKIDGRLIALAVFNFNFMGGSMGACVGERLTCLIEHAIEKKLPLVVVCTSGGARMQESIFSLMQMAKTSAALAKLSEKRLPYISILTNPTTGGVTASFASLGDVIIAEPKALICFAGPRVIEQTIGAKLPENAQKAEFLLEHGLIDCIIKRDALRKKLSDLLSYLQNAHDKQKREAYATNDTTIISINHT